MKGARKRERRMDGKSGDLLAGIKRVPACLKHGPSALIRDEDTSISVLTRKSCIRVSYSQKSFTHSLSLSLSLSFYLSVFLYHNLDFLDYVLQTVLRRVSLQPFLGWLDRWQIFIIISRNFN